MMHLLGKRMMNKRMSCKSRLPIGLGLFFASALSWSEIVFDGTTGTAGPAAGPSFLITEADGLVSGNTLVHSFSEFSIASGESATFTGSDNITLLLNRVTGNTPSTINGAISSEIFNADFYFLNPNGVIFGPDASISVPGAFTASTASRLSIDGVDAFDVNGDFEDASLTIADPERLTFIFDDAPSSISVEPGASLSNFRGITLVSSAIDVVGAQINVLGGLLALGSSDSRLSFDSGAASSPSGEIRLENTNVSVGGEVGGAVRIVGGELVFDGGGLNLRPRLEGSQYTATGDIELTNGYRFNSEPLNAGVNTEFLFEATNISISGGSELQTEVFGDEGLGMDLLFNASGSFELVESNILTRVGTSATNSVSGNVVITAPEIVFDGVLGDDATSGRIEAGSAGDDSSRVGAIEINAENLFYIKDGGGIRQATGAGGSVDIEAGEFRLTNSTDGLFFVYGDQSPSQIQINAGRLFASDSNLSSRITNNAVGGTFNLDVGDLTLTNGSFINTSTFGEADGLPINLNAGDIQLTGGSFLASNTLGAGRGGEIDINASGRVLIEGSQSGVRATTADISGIDDVEFLNFLFTNQGFGEGEGGIIRVSADKLVMQDGALISSFAAETDAAVIGREVQTGNAGDVFLIANQLSLVGGSVIETLAEESAGGNLDIRAADFTAISDSTIRTDAQGALPDNRGADILINTGSLFFGNAGISANAAGANGGDITIITDRFIRDSASRVTSSSNLRISGGNAIDGLVNDDSDTVTEDAVSGEAAFPDIAPLLAQRCAAAELTNRSSFSVSEDKQKAPAPTRYELSAMRSGTSGNNVNGIYGSYDLAGTSFMASCFY
jgi:filamentous hemagglutinin family protein